VRAYLNAGGRTTRLPIINGTFSGAAPLSLGGNEITVVVVGADGGTSVVRRRVVSTNTGDPIGSVVDPAGDDNGPGSYVYPSNDAFVDGAFDVTRLAVSEDAEDVHFAVTLDGEITNPWGGDQISVQRFDLYLRTGSGAGSVPARPGTNAALAAPYDLVITADGFVGSAVRDADGETVGSATLTAVPERKQVVISVPRSVLGPTMALDSTQYALTVMSHADEGEGAGGIRPVYSLEYWQSTAGTDMSWIRDYRFGGGAGEWTGDHPSRDTDTSDPNVLDILVPPGAAQSEVLDWTAGAPVRLPYVPLGTD
jgi:carbohydrate-binding DOMON domain-containing protein